MKLFDILFEQEEPKQPFSSELTDALKEFLANNSIDKLLEVMPEIKKLVSSREYPEILDPEGIKVYRGLKLSSDKEVEELCAGKNYDEVKSANGAIYRTFHGSGDMPARRSIQSWSANKNVGIQFAIDPEIGGIIPVVFVTTAKQGIFFGKAGEIAKLVLPRRASEMETISISKPSYEGFVVAIPPDDGFFGRNPHLVSPAKLKELVSTI